MITLTELAPGPAGSPLLLVGPSLGTAVASLWADAAAALGAHVRVVGWDLPGHGASAPASGFGLDDLAAELVARVDEPFHYAGVSVAGAVGLHLGLLGSDLVRSVAVVCSGAKLGTSESWHERAALVCASGTGALVEGSRSRWFSDATRAGRSDLVEALLAELAEVDDAGYAAVCEALAAHDVRARLGEVTVPVLALGGADDTVCPPAMLAEVASGVASGRHVSLTDVAHLAPAEAPAATVAALREHLGA